MDTKHENCPGYSLGPHDAMGEGGSCGACGSYPPESGKMWFCQDASGYMVGSGDVELSLPMSRDLASRIVACVNACAGIEDPASELARLRRVEAAAQCAVLNAVLIPDPQMQGTTDTYAVPLDDIIALRAALED